MLTCSSCGSENPDAQKFCGECGTPLSTSGEARRRLVTALFCDLVGSTTLGEQHDPEVLRPILERYFSDMRSAIERHGGRVEKFIGDAVSAVFVCRTRTRTTRYEPYGPGWTCRTGFER